MSPKYLTRALLQVRWWNRFVSPEAFARLTPFHDHNPKDRFVFTDVLSSAADNHTMYEYSALNLLPTTQSILRWQGVRINTPRTPTLGWKRNLCCTSASESVSRPDVIEIVLTEC